MIDEISETNNNYAKQFVWSPLAMTNGVPLTRAMPPDAEGGWGDIPAAAPKYNNVDGLRETFTPGLGCIVTAVVPGAGSDVDLDWFTPSTGPSNGSTTPLVTSERGTDLTDLLVECYDGSSRSYDIGVRKFAGTNQSYRIQSLTGDYRGNDPAVIGPATIALGAIVRAYFFFRSTSAPMTVVLQNLSGTTDLGMSIYKFDTAGPRTMSSTLPGGYVDAQGAPARETAVINQNLLNAGIGIVVWKTGAVALGKTATFRLLIDPGTTGAGTPPPFVAPPPTIACTR